MKTVLLTGVGGFVGSHTLRHILDNTDWHVIGLDSFRHRGKLDRVKEQLKDHDPSRYTHLVYDLRIPFSPQFEENLKNVDYVISMASESHVDRSITDPREFIENNINLILTLVEWAKNAHIEKFIQISTDEVYGPIRKGGHKEGSPHRPSNPYSASKSAQESICYSYWRTYGVPVIITNTMNLIGSFQDVEKYIPKTIKAIYNNETITVHADENNIPGTRFYLHARNQADALLFILRNITPLMYPSDDLARFNVVGEYEIDNLALAQMIAEYMNKPLKYEFVNYHLSRPGHDRRYGLNGNKISELGWKAPVEFHKSLEDTVKWYLANPEWLV